jgi:transcriptional regulator with XRE-family HTH domain
MVSNAVGSRRMVKAPRLRVLRLRKALTQDELATLSGVGRQTIIRVEAGYEAHPPTIRKLAQALGVEPHELMEDEG